MRSLVIIAAAALSLLSSAPAWAHTKHAAYRGHHHHGHSVARQAHGKAAVSAHASEKAPAISAPGQVARIVGAPAKAAAAVLGEMLGIPDGYEDGIATPLPVIALARPRHIEGHVSIAGQLFSFVSGGLGWSIPWGDWLITPSDVGRWGARHHAIGLNGDSMYDAQLHRDREGIEIHAARSGATDGCVGISAKFDDFKSSVLAMIAQAGHAYLHIGPNFASVTPSKTPDRMVIYLTTTAAVDDDPPPRPHHHRQLRLARS